MATELQPSYYTSKWSGEEIDRLLEGGNMVITERLDNFEALRSKYPLGKDGYFFTSDTKEVYWWDKTASAWVSLGNIEGPMGATGAGIDKIERTSGTGLAGSTDVYTVTLTDGKEYTFTVVNGRDGNIADAEAANNLARQLLKDTQASAASAHDSAQSARDYSGKPPQIGNGGDWEVWDAESGDYTTTGQPARGPQGETAITVKVGGVTTGAPGTEAKVENSGDDKNLVLDFTIPRGAAGEVTREALDAALAEHAARSWTLEVTADKWVAGTDTWEEFTGSWKAELTAEGMTAETVIDTVNFVSGSLEAASTWVYYKPGAGTVTLWSRDKPTEDFTIRLTEVVV